MKSYETDNSSKNSQNQSFLHPQFDNQGGWGSSLKKWIKKDFNRIILPLMAVIVIAAGFYVYLNQNKKTALTDDKSSIKETPNANPENESENLNISLSDEQLLENNPANETLLDLENLENSETKETEENQEQAPVNKEKQDAIQETQIIEKTETQITINAKSGEGITHLARKTIKEYLKTNDLDFELKKEHLIFAEDYLQNQQGSRLLERNEQVLFNISDIAKSLELASQLKENQLNNLSKYVPLTNL